MTPAAPLRAVPAASPERAAAGAPPGAREAALLLHSLAPSDREWLVAELPEQERAALRPLLAELADLGVRTDRTIVEAALAARRERPAADDPASVRSTRLDALSGADPERLAALLAGEPPAVAVELLGMRAWPWRGEVVQRLERMGLRGISGAASTGATPDAPGARGELRAALVEALIRRLGERPPEGRREAGRLRLRWGMWRRRP